MDEEQSVVSDSWRDCHLAIYIEATDRVYCWMLGVSIDYYYWLSSNFCRANCPCKFKPWEE